jgi:hypothetical protein
MTQDLLDDDGWSAVIARLPGDLDLAATARAERAFLRARGVRSAPALLRLALIYGGTSLALRGTSAWARAAGLARLSDVALLGRLQNAAGWLGAIVAAQLSAALRPTLAGPAAAGRRVRLVDASMIGPHWRLHAEYEPARSRFVGFELSDGRQAESLERFRPGPGDLVVADRGYAKARQLAHVAAEGAGFLVRRGLTGCRLLRRDGGKFELAAALAPLAPEQTAEFAVLVPLPAGPPLDARLIVHRLTPEQAEGACRRARRKAAKAGQRACAKRLVAAEYVMLLASPAEAELSAAQALELYRLRWQIELAFKRLKSLIGLADLAAKEPQLVRSCLYAKLILALLSEDALQDLLDSPPCAPGRPAALALAAPAPCAARPAA